MRIPNEVWLLVHARTGFTASEVLGTRRDGRLPDARHCVMYALLKAGWGVSDVARAFCRDRGTVRHAFDKVDAVVVRDKTGKVAQFVGQIVEAARPHLFFDRDAAIRKPSRNSAAQNPYARYGV